MAPERVYWDTSCFVSFISGLHPDEVARAEVCEAVLREARNDEIQIITSVWTIAETIRPRAVDTRPALPMWHSLLRQTDATGSLLYPKAEAELTEKWNFYRRHTPPTRLLSEEQSQKIRRMFDWKWIRLVQVDPALATRATEIARKHNMKAADSIHVATALSQNCARIHRWDRDYQKTDTLIPSVEPAPRQPISTQPLLPLQP